MGKSYGSIPPPKMLENSFRTVKNNAPKYLAAGAWPEASEMPEKATWRL